MVDRSFGFDTAVQESLRAIQSALVEASCAPNGIGLVKLMGRDAGFIAGIDYYTVCLWIAFATMSSHDVDLCLIPEVHSLLSLWLLGWYSLGWSWISRV